MIADPVHVGQARTPLPDDQGMQVSWRDAQVQAIASVFARRTTPERASFLATLCYLKTLNTPFTPVDIAEIALAETGGHRLSAKAVSAKGALGVWQLMPVRAKSHGFSPAEMRNDAKCAEAAVKELSHKLVMAGGNLRRAKRFYCGQGPDAARYELRRLECRSEILAEIARIGQQQAVVRLQPARRRS